RLGEQHAHRIAHRDRLLVDRTLRLNLRERGCGQLHRGVERQRRELLALCFLHRFGLLLRELAQPAQEILRIAAEREPSETAAFHATTLAKRYQVAALNLLDEGIDRP